MSKLNFNAKSITEQGGLEPWKVLQDREVFKAPPWIKVSVQTVELPDGKLVDDYYRIDLGQYIVVYAQTSERHVIVERQYKHGLGEVTLTMPSGSIEGDESPLVAAQRELLEETGYVSDEWQSMGSFVVNGNQRCAQAHYFTAANAHKVAEPNSGDLEAIQILLMSPGEVLEALRAGGFRLLSSSMAVALMMNPLLAPASGGEG
jgi:ADP-ribose pyrophosphatase